MSTGGGWFDEDGGEEDAEDLEGLEDLLEEIPAIRIVTRFAASAARINWFAHVGEHIDDILETRAREYLDALGFPDVEVAPLHDWAEAAEAAENLDFDSTAWEAEEQLRAGLATDAVELVGEDALELLLTHVSARVSGPIRVGAEEAAALDGIEDEEAVTAAAGAAVQACHHAALVIAASGEPDHPFALKFTLFEAGHWPVGIAGRSFNLF